MPAHRKSSAVNGIVDRCSEERWSNISNDSLAQTKVLVESSYFGELLDLAVISTKDTSYEVLCRSLKSKIESLEVFVIRNAMAHPNREFFEVYWYRMAAIVADPILEHLGIFGPRAELEAAEDGEIRDVSEEWWSRGERYTWNNLPSDFAHDVTGLIGRKIELEELKSLIVSKRNPVVTIVAPGGMGKTAIALDSLNTVVHDVSLAESLDAVFFISLKQEELTASGVKKLDAPDCMEALQRHLDELIKDSDVADSSNVILCVDNLETVLLDGSMEFDDWLEKMPAHWKIIITSRIALDGAKTFPLKGLNTQGGELLARKYAEAIDLHNVSNDLLKSIAASSASNPLAIRLQVDRLRAGGDVNIVSGQTEADIIDFSFRALVESLPQHSCDVLECLFACGGSADRGQVHILLGLAVEETTEAINCLGRTSLITKELDEDSETLELAESVRIMLRDRPLDFKLRSEFAKKINATRAANRLHSSIQKHNTDPTHWDYISESVPDYLRKVLIDAMRLFKKPGRHEKDYQQIEKVGKSLQSLPRESKNYAEYWLTLGRLRESQRDCQSALEAYTTASKIEGLSSSSNKLRYTCRLNLGRFLSSESMVDEAVAHLEKLNECEAMLGEDIPEVVVTRFSSMYVSLLMKCDRIDLASSHLNLVKKHKIADTYKGFIPACSAQLEIAKVKRIHKSDCLSAVKGLTRSAEILSDALSKDNESRHAIGATLYLNKELGHLLSAMRISDLLEESTTKLLCKSEELYELVYNISGLKIRDKRELLSVVKDLIKKLTDSKNPFNKRSWLSRCGIQIIDNCKHKLEEGWIPCEVVVVNGGYELPRFIMCKDETGQMYFAGRQGLKDLDLIAWSRIEKGYKIAISGISTPVSAKGRERGRETYPVPKYLRVL